MDRNKLPVEIFDNELPRDEVKKSDVFGDDNVSKSSGFADAIFLGALMVVCFMWGMLVVILR